MKKSKSRSSTRLKQEIKLSKCVRLCGMIQIHKPSLVELRVRKEAWGRLREDTCVATVQLWLWHQEMCSGTSAELSDIRFLCWLVTRAGEGDPLGSEEIWSGGPNITGRNNNRASSSHYLVSIILITGRRFTSDSAYSYWFLSGPGSDSFVMNSDFQLCSQEIPPATQSFIINDEVLWVSSTGFKSAEWEW